MCFDSDGELLGSYIVECDYCNGTGDIECDCTEGMGKKWIDRDCPECKGIGTVICPECNGTGNIWKRKESVAHFF